jgi:murein DD-endopeptidase MepM/ murein hydrolase activator NlpD
MTDARRLPPLEFFPMPTTMPAPTATDDSETWIDTTVGASLSGRVSGEGPSRPRRVGVRHRTLHLAVVGTLAIILALAGQPVAQAVPAASGPSGNYAHPCPQCHLVQGFKRGVHNGLDLAAPIGTPIYAAAAGRVTAAGPRDPAGFGQVVYIDNDDGTVAWYGHIDTWLAHVGDSIVTGQQIATVGDRGNARGPHLHFEIHRRNAINPIRWLHRHGINI